MIVLCFVLLFFCYHLLCLITCSTVFSMSHALNKSKQNDINKTAVEELELRTCAQILADSIQLLLPRLNLV